MVKIHFNDVALRHIAQCRAADHEGRLLYRTTKDSCYRERWFRLCGNLLFYFRTNELGAVVDAGDPVGVLVLAVFSVKLEEYGDRPFVFSITFAGEEGRKHFFSGQSNQQCVLWVQALRGCGYGDLRTQLESLRSKIERRTGRDPLSDRLTVSRPPGSEHARSTGRTTKFYVASASGERPTFAFSTTDCPPVPPRRASRQPTQPLVQLLDPSAETDSARVHTSAAKAAAFSDWETFN